MSLVGDSIMVTGGAEWKFDPSCWGSDNDTYIRNPRAISYDDMAIKAALRKAGQAAGHAAEEPRLAVYIGSLQERNWQQVVRPLEAPPCRAGPAVTLCGRHLVLCGGVDLVRRRYFNDAWTFDTRSHRWQMLTLTRASLDHERGRSHATLARARGGSAVVSVGGARYFEGAYFNDISVLASSGSRTESDTERREREWYGLSQADRDLHEATRAKTSAYCAVCKKGCTGPSVKLLRCSRCQDVLYCSKDCQRQDWRIHKTVCGKAGAITEPAQAIVPEAAKAPILGECDDDSSSSDAMYDSAVEEEHDSEHDSEDDGPFTSSSDWLDVHRGRSDVEGEEEGVPPGPEGHPQIPYPFTQHPPNMGMPAMPPLSAAEVSSLLPGTPPNMAEMLAAKGYENSIAAMQHYMQAIDIHQDERVLQLVARLGIPTDRFPGNMIIINALVQAGEASDANLALLFGHPNHVRATVLEVQMYQQHAEFGSPADTLFGFHQFGLRP